MDLGDTRGGGPSLVGWALRQAVIWGGLTLTLYVAVGHRAAWLPSFPTPHPQPSVSVDGRNSAAAANTLSYRADPQGHVILDAVVNGTPMPFMLDTGATVVALTPGDAAAAGIARYELEFNRRVQTANGEVKAAPVKLREIRLGQLSVDDVPAIVVENLQVSLLGQSFLRRLQSYQMRDGVLTITW